MPDSLPAAPLPGPVPLRAYPDNGLADYVLHSRYTRHRPDLGRRETFAEALGRAADMHRTFLAGQLGLRVAGHPASTAAAPAEHALLSHAVVGQTVASLLDAAFAAALGRRVLPSLRSLQFGGPAILGHHARLYNCAFSPADRPAFFREFLYLLLAGTGCGFSVQRHHVARLPPLASRPLRHPPEVRPHRIADTIEGWADALDFLVRSHLEGFRAAFDYGLIRPAGSPLVTSGGHANGALPLRRSLEDIDSLLRRASGRQLRPIEVHDLCLLAARAVLSRGPRRSASICLFSADDEEMLHAKSGSWARRHPERATCDLAAVLGRDPANAPRFRRILAAQLADGEPGCFLSDHPDHGCNPCGEVGLHPVLEPPLPDATLERLRAAGLPGPLPPDARLSGWQLCNLSTINGGAVRSAADFLGACVHASVLGTIQAAYASLGYLGPVTCALAATDALLGVSICGCLDQPGLLLDPGLLERGARLARAVNQLLAPTLGLTPAARVTCVKPEGTAALLLGTAAGVHPHHARHYFRRVRAPRTLPVYRHFQAANPAMTEPSALAPGTDDVITFPLSAPPGALVRDDVGALAFLGHVRLLRRHWVIPGEAPHPRSPGLHHNVSHTCTVHPEELDAVADFLWDHREEFSGITILGPSTADRFAQPPLQAVVTEADIRRWNHLGCHPVDYSRVPDDPDPAAGIRPPPCTVMGCTAP
jgi:ribonucleoside-triphosphate reductase